MKKALLILFMLLSFAESILGTPPVFDIKTAFDALFGPGKRFENYREDLAEYFYNSGALDLGVADEKNIRQYISSFRNRFPSKFGVSLRPSITFVGQRPLHSEMRSQKFLLGIPVRPFILFNSNKPLISMLVPNTFVFENIAIQK